MRAGSAILCLLLSLGGALGQHFDVGGSVRGYAFWRAEESTLFQSRSDTEFLSGRLVPGFSAGAHFKVETHLVFDLVTPPSSGITTLASARARTYLPLERNLRTTEDVQMTGYFDRLNVQLRTDAFELVMGRQAVTWGVNYFWPALDLFAPFAPNRIDRDYKPGVDALRLIVPVGQYSEVQVIGASLGPAPSHDRAVGALLRLNLGPADLGFMGGDFHRDKVAGTFISANVRGTGLRAEVSWTQSGDPLDQYRRRGVFWRGSLGVDRQLSPSLNLTAELACNEYGTDDPRDYALILSADRLARGEVNGLGRVHTGVSLGWKFHPLGTLSNAALFNWDDSSMLWIPSVTWSLANSADLLVGAELGFGRAPAPTGLIRSEYGSYPNTIFIGFKGYL
jgi:hypothetical protein